MKTAWKIIVWVLLALIVALLICRSIYSAPKPVGWQEYAVKSGDTLWGIASAYGGDYDPRDIINDIEQKNGCDAYICVGDVLLVPEY